MKFTLVFLMMEFACMAYSQLSFPNFHGPAALGKASIFSIQPGIQAVYGNPSQLANNIGWSANLSAQNQFEIPELTCAQVALFHGTEKFGSMAISVQQLGANTYRDQKFQLSYAKKLSKNFRIGTGFHWWHTQSPPYEPINMFTVDFGISYRFLKQYELGIYLFNPFYQHYSPERYAPAIMAVGFRYSLNPQIDLLLEAEKNTYLPMKIKVAIQYQPVDRYQLSLGMATVKGSPSISGGFQFKTKFNMVMDFGLNFHPVLGLSSAIGFDYYIRGRKED